MYHIQFELFCTDQDSRIFEILKFPSEPLISSVEKWNCRYWVRGRTHSLSSNKITKIIDKLSSVTLNELSLYSKDIMIHLSESQLYKTKFNSHLDISPTSNVWDSVWDYEIDDLKHIQEEQRRMSYESNECSLRYNDIQKRPSLYTFSLILNETINLHDLIHPIAKTIYHANMNCNFLGGAKIISSESFGYDDALSTLAPWAKTYEMIGNYLDCLRPIIIASDTLCRNIKNTFSLHENNLITISKQDSTPIGILYIPESILEDETSIKKVNKYLVAKDETTKNYSFKESIGEFILPHGGVIYTFRRLKDLMQKKILPRVHHNQIVSLVLPSKYCDLLEIDQDDMLARIFQKRWIEMFTHSLDICFERLSEVSNMKERILLAYEKALKENSMYVAYLGLLKNLYFK
jgi:hypothetical protein